jgi:CheY-like chemotaxis protein
MLPLRILIVDDCPDNCTSMAMLVVGWGHDVRLAPDGPSALEAFREFRPQAVLLDIGLPGMSGWEVGRRLRAEKFGGLVVALTGYGREQDLDRSRAAGFDAHLIKPAEPAELQRLLANARALLPAGTPLAPTP